MELWWVINSYTTPHVGALSVYHNPGLGIPSQRLPISGEVRGKEGRPVLQKEGTVTRKYRHFTPRKMGTRTWTNKKRNNRTVFSASLRGFDQRTGISWTNSGSSEGRIFVQEQWRGGGFNQQKLGFQATSDAGNTSNGVRGCKVGPRPPVFRGGLGLGINHQWFVLIWSILSIILSITAQLIPPYK